MKSSTKRFLSFAFLILTFAIVMFIGLKGNDPALIWKELKSISPLFILALVVCWFLYMAFETLSMHLFLINQKFRLSFFSLFRIVLIGNYYSNITPASTGGQPMQIYYLKKLGIPVGIGTSILTIRFFVFQLSLLTIGIIMWSVNGSFIYNQLGNKMWLVISGFFFNSLSVIGVLLLAINKRLVRWLSNKTISLLDKIRLIKNKDKIQNKVNNIISTFNESVTMIRKDTIQLLIQYIVTCVQLLVLYYITVVIYKAFNLNGTSASELITLSALLLIAASYTPLPGASGAQEGGYAVFFNGVFTGSTLFSSLLLWRFFTYYTTLIIGLFMNIRSLFINKKSEQTTYPHQ